MDNNVFFDGRILIWEPDLKEYLETVWHDGYIEYKPETNGFEVYILDNRPYMRISRSTHVQRKTIIKCSEIKSDGVISNEGTQCSFRYLQSVKRLLYAQDRTIAHVTRSVTALYELKFESTPRECLNLKTKLEEIRKSQAVVPKPDKPKGSLLEDDDANNLLKKTNFRNPYVKSEPGRARKRPRKKGKPELVTLEDSDDEIVLKEEELDDEIMWYDPTQAMPEASTAPNDDQTPMDEGPEASTGSKDVEEPSKMPSTSFEHGQSEEIMVSTASEDPMPSEEPIFTAPEASKALVDPSENPKMPLEVHKIESDDEILWEPSGSTSKSRLETSKMTSKPTSVPLKSTSSLTLAQSKSEITLSDEEDIVFIDFPRPTASKIALPMAKNQSNASRSTLKIIEKHQKVPKNGPEIKKEFEKGPMNPEKASECRKMTQETSKKSKKSEKVEILLSKLTKPKATTAQMGWDEDEILPYEGIEGLDESMDIEVLSEKPLQVTRFVSESQKVPTPDLDGTKNVEILSSSSPKDHMTAQEASKEPEPTLDDPNEVKILSTKPPKTSKTAQKPSKVLKITLDDSDVIEILSIKPKKSTKLRRRPRKSLLNTSDGILKLFCGICQMELPTSEWKTHQQSLQHKRLHYWQRMKLIKGSKYVPEKDKNDMLPEERRIIEEALEGPGWFSKTRTERTMKLEIEKRNQRHMHGRWDVEVDWEAIKKHKKWICERCDYECPGKETLKEHMKEHDLQDEAGPSSFQPKVLTFYSCDLCLLNFNTPEDLEVHKNTSEYHLRRRQKAINEHQVNNIIRYTHKHYALAVRRY